MITLKANDAAVVALGLTDGLAIQPPAGLAPALQEVAGKGIVRRGDVLTWSDSAGRAEAAPGIFQDLTGWECADSRFHLEDHVPVNVIVIDGTPFISEDDQNVLLLQGLALALRLRTVICELDQPVPLRCIVGANSTNATFRFHQIRAGETWTVSDLDSYQTEKIVVLDIEPAAANTYDNK